MKDVTLDMVQDFEVTWQIYYKIMITKFFKYEQYNKQHDSHIIKL